MRTNSRPLFCAAEVACARPGRSRPRSSVGSRSVEKCQVAEANMTPLVGFSTVIGRAGARIDLLARDHQLRSCRRTDRARTEVFSCCAPDRDRRLLADAQRALVLQYCDQRIDHLGGGARRLPLVELLVEEQPQDQPVLRGYPAASAPSARAGRRRASRWCRCTRATSGPLAPSRCPDPARSWPNP